MVRIFAVCLIAYASEVSPVQKVLQLLDELKGKVQADVANEKKAFEENAAFCHDETKDKNYAIKTATRRIDELQAAVEERSGNIQENESVISKVSAEIAAKERELAEAKSVRKEENGNFQAAEKELVDTIDTLARAIAIIKKEMSFAQVSGVPAQVRSKLGHLTLALSQIVDAAWMDSRSQKALQSFLQSSHDDDDSLSLAQQPQAKQVAYESQSGNIVATLEDMKDKAESALQDARKQEMKEHHSFDMVSSSLSGAIANKKERHTNASNSKAEDTQAKGKAEGELASTQKNKAADEKYLSALANDCSSKKAAWEEREKSSSEEIAAIEKAQEILSSGVKALVQLSAHTTRQENSDRRNQAVDLLRNLSRKFKSFALVQAAQAAASDPFQKVRGLIEQMISKLQDEANKEATHEAFCQEEMAKTKKSRDSKSMKADKFQARIEDATSTIAELRDSIRELESQISANDKASREATQIRNDEHNEYNKASKDYKDSAEAVARAIEALSNYYQSGNTPDSARGDAGHSIISILEVAESDFTRLLAEAEAEERQAQDAYDELSKKNRESNLAKNAEVKGKESEVKSLEVALTHHREDHQTVSKELDAVMGYLDKLKPDCASKAMSYEERKARREAEIDGLHEALEILSVEDASLIQTKQFLRPVARRY